MGPVGVVGTGNIGAHHVWSLLGAGREVVAFDVDNTRLDAACRMGAEAADSAQRVAESTTDIVLSLPSSEAVEDVVSAMMPALDERHLVVDTSTVRPSTVGRCDETCRRAGAVFVDAPVTWRREGLIVMVGTAEEHLPRVKDALQPVAYRIEHVGSVGDGQLLKQVNQLVLGIQMAAHAEGVEHARRLGLDPRLIRDALEFPVSETLFGDDFTGNGELALHTKDLGYILETARERNAPVPFTEATYEVFEATKRHGQPNWLQAGIVTWWRRLNDGF